MTCWPRAPCRLSICSLYSLSGLLSFSLSSFPALVLKDLFCSLHAQTVAQFRITCTELWSPIKEGLWIGVDLQMLLHPAVMVNEPHESQELLCFNPWRLYYESMMIWYIGLLWHPHWYFIWFLIFAQQERSKCSDLSCPHYISPIKQLDTVIFLPHFPFEVTALPHYYTLGNRENCLLMVGWPEFEFLSPWGWTGHQTYYYLLSVYCAFYRHLFVQCSS